MAARKKNEFFSSVKTCNHLGHILSSDDTESSRHSEGTRWNKLWALSIPPTVKHFGWPLNIICQPKETYVGRASKWRIAVVCANKWKLLFSSSKNALGLEEFSLSAHCFEKCKYRRQNWRTSLFEMLYSKGEGFLEQTLLILWSIYQSQNKLIFDVLHTSPPETVSKAFGLLQEYQAANASSQPLNLEMKKQV